MADDAEEFGQHDADDLGAVGHLDARQLLHGQHVGEVVHHAAEVVHAVGVGDVGVPGLPLAHLLGAAVVEADLADQVHDLLAVELEDDPQDAVRAGVVRADVEEHEVEVLAAGAACPSPRAGTACASCMARLVVRRHAERAHLGGAGGVLLAQRVALPPRRHEDARQVRMARRRVMPNMSQTSRSYQLAAGQRSVIVGSDG